MKLKQSWVLSHFNPGILVDPLPFTLKHIRSRVVCSRAELTEGMQQFNYYSSITAISVFSISSVLFLAIGFLCGCYYKKEKKPNLYVQEEVGSPQYQEIQLIQECRKNVVEVKKNVAYASVSLVSH